MSGCANDFSPPCGLQLPRSLAHVTCLGQSKCTKVSSHLCPSHANGRSAVAQTQRGCSCSTSTTAKADPSPRRPTPPLTPPLTLLLPRPPRPACAALPGGKEYHPPNRHSPRPSCPPATHSHDPVPAIDLRTSWNLVHASALPLLGWEGFFYLCINPPILLSKEAAHNFFVVIIVKLLII